MRIGRAVLMVLDSVGIGEAPDAAEFGDEGSNTLANTAAAVGGLRLPHLGRLGLGNLTGVLGVPPEPSPQGAFGRMQELSRGKDTTTGHWEIAGVILDRPFPVYPGGFPTEVVSAVEEAWGRGILGNKPASGTAILEELGEEHLRTGKPIVYTSADSVFQVACHEEVASLDELYEMCRKARRILQGEHGVGRVIARPFTGRPGSFRRTGGRRDFSLEPPRPTLLDHLTGAGIPVFAVGKVGDIFAGRGISEARPTRDNMETVDATLAYLRAAPAPSLIFANCVDFDTVWGHRNDPRGYAKALEAFDRRLPELLQALGPQDALFIVADHGCDPTTPSTDHSRELVPLLAAGPAVRAGIDLGTRRTFADVAAALAEAFGVENPGPGTSFWGSIARGEQA